MEDYKKLIDLYNSQRDRGEREAALLEKQIWEAALPTLPRISGSLPSKREWLAERLGITPYAIEGRSTLLGYGAIADEIWRRVEEDGMPLRTGVRLMRDAKIRAMAMGLDLAEVVSKVLADHDDLPAARLPDGRVFHKRNPGMLPRTPTPKVDNKPLDEDPKLFWANLRGMISGYFHTRLDGVDQGVVERVWRDLEIELKVLLEHFQHKIDRMRRDRDDRKQGVARSKIIQACHVLNLDPPVVNKSVDEEFKKKAKKHFRKLASLYHPDKSGSEDTRELYESVVDAFRTLEDL